MMKHTHIHLALWQNILGAPTNLNDKQKLNGVKWPQNAFCERQFYFIFSSMFRSHLQKKKENRFLLAQTENKTVKFKWYSVLTADLAFR